MGSVAQDFYAASGLGDSEPMIRSIASDGVDLGGVQVLAARTENASQQAQIEALQARLDPLEAMPGRRRQP